VKRLLLAPVVVGALVLLAPSPAAAHPLGNFTTNTYAGIVVSPDRAVIDYVVDLAEIPTVQQGDTLRTAGASGTCTRLAGGLRLRVGGRASALAVERAAITNPPGQAGLATTRIECRLTAPAAVGSATDLAFTDGNYGGRLGWRELTATTDGVALLRSDVPRASISQRLTAYPVDRLKSPLTRTSARLRVEPGGEAPAGGGGATAPAPATGLGGVDAATRRFTALVADRALSPGFALAALALALALGALHSLAPGHGKTVMAAYLVGQRGTRRQALGVGLTVAVTHTAGVLVLGVVLTTTQVVAPERLYPMLGLAGGLMVAAVGAGLLSRSLRHPVAPHHHHHHHHDHGDDHHHDHHHDRGHDHNGPAPMGRRGVIAMGLAGGMVPSPSALLVLLGAVALGRAWFGVALVLAYGLGMAATLVAAGLLLARASAAVERLLAGRTVTALLVRALPALSAAVVLVLGLTVAVRATGQL
jgi:ABC-type nickel/cobalt efflux system permease component RcnA